MSTTDQYLSPIEYVKLRFPDKPPQYAYQLLKQGLPHTEQEHKGKIRPRIDVGAADAWLQNQAATSDGRTTRHSKNKPPTTAETDNTETTQNASTSAYRPGRLFAYERLPRIMTVGMLTHATKSIDGQIELVHLLTALRAREALDTLTPLRNTRAWTNEFRTHGKTDAYSAQHLRTQILENRLFMDDPRTIVALCIAALRALPTFLNDLELADELQETLERYPKKDGYDESIIQEVLDTMQPGDVRLASSKYSTHPESLQHLRERGGPIVTDDEEEPDDDQPGDGDNGSTESDGTESGVN